MISWIEACRMLGISIKINNSMIDLIKDLVGLAAEDIAYIITGDEVKAKILADVKRRIYLGKINSIETFPGVVDGVKELKRLGLKIAIASSTSRATIEAVLKKTNIYSFVDAYVGSDEVVKRKPEPDMFLEAMKRIGVEPREAIVVGDTKYDIAPANMLGAISILICWRRCNEVDVKPTFYAYNMDDVVEIAKILLKMKVVKS